MKARSILDTCPPFTPFIFLLFQSILFIFSTHILQTTHQTILSHYMANFLHDDQETLSLTDFPLAQHPHSNASIIKDHPTPSSSSSSSSSSSNSEELFEFFSDYSEDKMMSHAEDIIFCGKLLTINQHLHLTQPPRQNEMHHRRDQPLGCRRSRSESRSDVKTTTVGPFLRNSGSLHYKKLKRNSSMSSEPAAEISRDGSGKKSSSRRHVLSYGLVNVRPTEMNIRELKNRQFRLKSSSLDELSVSRNFDNRKSSWRVLEFLSCKPSSRAVMTPLSYMAKV